MKRDEDGATYSAALCGLKRPSRVSGKPLSIHLRFHEFNFFHAGRAAHNNRCPIFGGPAPVFVSAASINNQSPTALSRFIGTSRMLACPLCSESGQIADSLEMSALCRLCCQSLFALVIKNSPGCRRLSCKDVGDLIA